MCDQFLPFYACLMANYGKKLIIFVILAISLSEKSMRQIQNHYKYVAIVKIQYPCNMILFFVLFHHIKTNNI